MEFIETKENCFYLRGTLQYDNVIIDGKNIRHEPIEESYNDYEYEDNEYVSIGVVPFFIIKVYIPKNQVLYDILEKANEVRITGHTKSELFDLKRDKYANFLLGIAEYKFECSHDYCQGRRITARLTGDGMIQHIFFRHYYIIIDKNVFLQIDRTIFSRKDLEDLNDSYSEDFLNKMPSDFLFKRIKTQDNVCEPYSKDGHVITINRCYGKVRHYKCSCKKTIFDISLPGRALYRLQLCNNYFRSKLETYDDCQLMSRPNYVKADALYSIIKEEFGYFLYDRENDMKLCCMPNDAEYIKQRRYLLYKDRSSNITGVLDRYVVYIPFYRGYCLRYSAYSIVEYLCSEIDFGIDSGYHNYLVTAITREFLRKLLEDIKEIFTKKDYNQTLKEINHINDWIDEKSSLLLMSAVKTLCKYYTNLKQKKNGKKRSKKHLWNNA